ncbi:hypothetical protein GIB67_025393 [Kingdonia uniflora]|uniref:C3H1-type domain-containing protein n=1 Tax=Kingdonia uniflora TaxID=39325 RepID=A0A7J7NBP5_9MAGN|nr:hypothetical protein GIB67_025393 [Kingdonia uniflora]
MADRNNLNANPNHSRGDWTQLVNTRPCKYSLEKCPYGIKCSFAHREEDIRKRYWNMQGILGAHPSGVGMPQFGTGNGVEDQRNILEEFVVNTDPIVAPTNEMSSSSNVIKLPPNSGGSWRCLFKTQNCKKYVLGTCPHAASNCNFAHGEQDKRIPYQNMQEMVGFHGDREEMLQIGRGNGEKRLQFGTGNWEEDQRIILKYRLCDKFGHGETCSYGETCRFPHEDPAKFRKSVVPTMGMGSSILVENSGIFSGSNQSQPNFTSRGPPPVEPISDLIEHRVNATRLSSYWKTRMCTQWETTGQCHFGDGCHYAHEPAELRNLMNFTEAQASGIASLRPPELQKVTNFTKMQASGVAPLIPSASSCNNMLPNSTQVEDIGILSKQQAMEEKVLRRMGLKKNITGIYGDWIDEDD